jgi:hypothetical protein
MQVIPKTLFDPAWAIHRSTVSDGSTWSAWCLGARRRPASLRTTFELLRLSPNWRINWRIRGLRGIVGDVRPDIISKLLISLILAAGSSPSLSIKYFQRLTGHATNRRTVLARTPREFAIRFTAATRFPLCNVVQRNP